MCAWSSNSCAYDKFYTTHLSNISCNLCTHSKAILREALWLHRIANPSKSAALTQTESLKRQFYTKFGPTFHIWQTTNFLWFTYNHLQEVSGRIMFMYQFDLVMWN